MLSQTHYRSCHVSGFGFVRWRNISLREDFIPDWVIAQYIVIYIEESRLEPPPKHQVKVIAFPDWHSEVWVNISIPLLSEIEVLIL
ncbi:hypothetical protein DFH28DRAFT_889209 [Melampsora americana]|nr:hypothetical protein DFH28DRAFT_889209 [Melampsora americana]